MIAQGTDGVSYGNMTTGVMCGADMMEFVPLHKMATEASPALRDWVMLWAPCETEFLTVEGCSWQVRRAPALLGLERDFGSSRGPFAPWQKTWCAPCYKMNPTLIFPHVMPTNDQGVVFKQKTDPNKSLVARNWDKLCVLFQCQFCWVQNLPKRNADPTTITDKRLMMYI
eukprot:187839-Ditylum_brightwellii.AAC.1